MIAVHNAWRSIQTACRYQPHPAAAADPRDTRDQPSPVPSPPRLGGRQVQADAVSQGGHLARLGYEVHLLADPHHAGPGDLDRIADWTMHNDNMETAFSPAALAQVGVAQKVAPTLQPGVRDMRQLLWSSIDNDDSRDLDQIEWAEQQQDGSIKIRVAIADVDALVPKGSPVDDHAAKNTTSIYTAPRQYMMLPDEFCKGMTSLNPDVDRLAIVTEYTVRPDGSIDTPTVYRALVNNHCKLAYNATAAWLERPSDLTLPPAMAAVPGAVAQVGLHDTAAGWLRQAREAHGSLHFHSQETKADIQDGKVISVQEVGQNRAQKLIEDLMVATNGANAHFLADHGYASIRRVVQTPGPQKWQQIVAFAHAKGGTLPPTPDAPALGKFLEEQKAKDPQHWPDLSLAVVKMIGRGQYVVEVPGQPPAGHFSLAVEAYAHTTAPNRLYADLVLQRIIKAAIAGQPPPYSTEELTRIAADCSSKEKLSKDIERSVQRSAHAAFLQDRIGEHLAGYVSFAGPRGDTVRLDDPPVEGHLAAGNVRQGDHIQVVLQNINIEQGHIDLALAP